MRVERLEVSVFRIPTDRPEADGTFQWDATTLVLVEAVASSGARGLGFSYTATAAAGLIRELLAPAIAGCSVDNVRAAWEKMIRAVRNVGRPGLASTAISAVDIALWDLKARLAAQPLFQLLGACRDTVAIYGSGGFTTYRENELAEQLAGWVEQGIPRVKMKVGKDWGTQPAEDLARVRVARQAIGPEAELFVDANGAYSAKQAIDLARRFAEDGVTYFEEPVSSDHLDQLAFIRRQIPLDVAAGEYGYDPWSLREMLRAQAADLAHGFAIPFSAHTAPAIHAQVGCAAPAIAHVEYFHDHAWVERLLFAGAPEPEGGCLRPDPGRPGLGLELKCRDAARWKLDV